MAGSGNEAETRRTIEGLERLVVRQVIRIALAIHTELVRSTPVDTGWARANWIPSVGTPFQGVAGSREAVSNGAQSAGVSRLLVYRLNQNTIWISNGVPYIQVLNAGHSKQAPAGFVEAAITRGIASVAR